MVLDFLRRFGVGIMQNTLTFQKFKIRIWKLSKIGHWTPSLENPSDIPFPGGKALINSQIVTQTESYGLLDLLSTPIKLHIRSNQAPISVKTRCFVTLKCMLNCSTFSGKMLQLQNLAIFFIKLP